MPGEEAEASAKGDELASLEGALKVLANEKRLRLLQYLTTPHYIREIATELEVARQSAQAHVNQLLELGLIEKLQGKRDHGPVTEFVVVPHRLFHIQESFSQLGRLEPTVEVNGGRHAMTEVLTDDGVSGQAPAVSRLVLVRGMRVGESAQLTGGGPWSIGRDPASTLCLDYDPYVSTRHAEVRRTATGGFELVDLYSRNGTTVDLEPLERGEVRALEAGALLGFGKTLVVLRRPS